TAIGTTRSLERELADNVAMIELAEAEGDKSVAGEAETAIIALRDRAEAMKLESMLSGEADPNDAYLEVHAGAGGTESQDWAGMLYRMYLRWSEQHGYKVDLLEETQGEGGVHRLVRISPFDSNARRHTSFASIAVFPVVDDRIKIEINEADVRVD